jgi:hypothetical protein
MGNDNKNKTCKARQLLKMPMEDNGKIDVSRVFYHRHNSNIQSKHQVFTMIVVWNLQNWPYLIVDSQWVTPNILNGPAHLQLGQHFIFLGRISKYVLNVKRTVRTMVRLYGRANRSWFTMATCTYFVAVSSLRYKLR